MKAFSFKRAFFKKETSERNQSLGKRKYNCLAVLFIVFISGCVQANLTPDSVVRQPDLFLGKKISIDGMARPYRVICTQIECEPENPCCNECGSSLALSGVGKKMMLRGDYQGRSIGCRGNECNLTCWPLDIDKKYRVTGTLKSSYGEYYLELENFVRVE